MKYIPKLFNEFSMKANLREVDPKGQTRRIIQPQMENAYACEANEDGTFDLMCGTERDGVFCDYPVQVKPPCQSGDVLWARETWFERGYWDDGFGYKNHYGYAADLADFGMFDYGEGELYVEGEDDLRSRSSMFMPRDACRYFGLVTKPCRAERVQDISEEDALAEGVTFMSGRGRATLRDEYRGIWNDINAKPKPVYGTVDGKKQIVSYVSYPWEDIREEKTHRGKLWHVIGNPWVWVISYARTTKPAGWPEV